MDVTGVLHSLLGLSELGKDNPLGEGVGQEGSFIWVLQGCYTVSLGLSELDKDNPVGEGGGKEGCHQAPVYWKEATG